MNRHYLFIIAFGLFVSISFSCKVKQEKQPEPQTAVPVVVDTIQPDTIVEEPIVVEPEIIKPDNKYFLIAASFKIEANAENFKNKLISKGYDSEVIIRRTGINQDFYKVSFKGFSDKKEAFRELRNEMSSGNFQEVWLLVK